MQFADRKRQTFVILRRASFERRVSISAGVFVAYRFVMLEVWQIPRPSTMGSLQLPEQIGRF